jgi:MinD superfamily P-loop ATPase
MGGGEMIDYIVPEINQDLCTGCGVCLAVCQPQALALVDGKAVLAYPDLCEYDGGCEPSCPEGAIQLPYLIVFGDVPIEHEDALPGHVGVLPTNR